MARDLDGLRMVITGANTGIGKVAALTLAQRGAELVLAGRSEDRTAPVLEDIRRAGGTAEFVHLDLADLGSVRDAAGRILELGRPIDRLINNAGLAGKRGTTADGFEIAFGTNHLGHFLLTGRLLPALLEAEEPRVVNVASRSAFQAKGIDFEALQQPTRTVTGLQEYAVSKLANILFTRELARRFGDRGLRAVSLHPGTIASEIWREVPPPLRQLMLRFMRTPEEGARTVLYCATSPDVLADENGGFYVDCKRRRPPKLAEDEALATRLWEESVAWTGAFT